MNAQRIGLIVWQAMPEGREKYNAYLCSREWAERKEAVLKRSGGICERCHTWPVENVHHLTYIRKYNERLEDLSGWCKACHEFTHGKTQNDPKVEYDEWMIGVLAEQRPLRSSISNAIHIRKSESLVVCPFCGSEHCHLGCPTYETHSEDGNQGIVTIPVSGECPHTWNIVFSGHKGTLVAYTRDGKENIDNV